MTHASNAVVVAGPPSPPSAWPTNADGDAPAGTTFRAAISRDREVAIIQLVHVGDRVASAAKVWSATFENADLAHERFRWLDARPADCVHLGRHARLFGAGQVGNAIEIGVTIERIRGEQERARLAREEERLAEEASINAAKALTIGSSLEDRQGQYGINLRRGDAAESFWIILFREKWERERFRDWFRYQRHRFAEWAEFLQDHAPIELERVLLAEMLATERKVKNAGLGAGGRRPLRFWRGEQ